MLALLAAVVAGAAAIFFALRARKAHAATSAPEGFLSVDPPKRPRPERPSAYAAAAEPPPPPAKPAVSVTPFELAPGKPAPLPPPPPVVATPQRLLPDHNVAVQALITPGLLTKVESAAVGQALSQDLFSDALGAIKGFQLALGGK